MNRALKQYKWRGGDNEGRQVIPDRNRVKKESRLVARWGAKWERRRVPSTQGRHRTGARQRWKSIQESRWTNSSHKVQQCRQAAVRTTPRRTGPAIQQHVTSAGGLGHCGGRWLLATLSSFSRRIAREGGNPHQTASQYSSFGRTNAMRNRLMTDDHEQRRCWCPSFCQRWIGPADWSIRWDTWLFRRRSKVKQTPRCRASLQQHPLGELPDWGEGQDGNQLIEWQVEVSSPGREGIQIGLKQTTRVGFGPMTCWVEQQRVICEESSHSSSNGRDVFVED